MCVCVCTPHTSQRIQQVFPPKIKDIFIILLLSCMYVHCLVRHVCIHVCGYWQLTADSYMHTDSFIFSQHVTTLDPLWCKPWHNHTGFFHVFHIVGVFPPFFQTSSFNHGYTTDISKQHKGKQRRTPRRVQHDSVVFQSSVGTNQRRHGRN